MQERVAAEVRQGWERAVSEQRGLNLASCGSSDVYASPPSRHCRADRGCIAVLVACTRFRCARVGVSFWLLF